MSGAPTRRVQPVPCERRVGIYRSVYPVASETFVTQQAALLRRYAPTLFVRTKTTDTMFPTLAVSDDDPHRLKQLRHKLTRSWRCFGRSLPGGIDLVHAHFGVDGVYAAPLAARLKVPLVVTIHGYEITSHRRPGPGWWRRSSQTKFQFVQYLMHERELHDQAAMFIAVSEYIKRLLLERRYPQEKVRVHYIGVDTDLFTPVRPCSPFGRYVLCVGRHTEKKGIDTLLRAWAAIARRHPDVTLLQVGAGPLTGRLLELSRELDVGSRVCFLGALPREEVRRLMQHAEVFCLPSRTAASGDAEGLGIVFNEASACGIPVVATRHGGIPEAVVHRETGWLVEESDAAALGSALDGVLSDRALGWQLGRRGREYVCERFCARTQTAALEDIYDAVSGGLPS